jgi:DNA-binding SARP family transcriptional activator/TolB-like protein
MIRLKLFGSIDLSEEDTRGRELTTVLHKPKRLALLSYLAIAAPGGFVRRDTLLGIFWPEFDQRHARGALSQALHVLRRALGEGVLPSRSKEEVGVDTAALWCDAVAFRSAIAEGRYEDALELYQGPLLDGVYLPAAPAFEQWLETERASLQAAAADAAWRLAERLEAEHPAAALPWARRALALTHLEEAALRRFVLLLDSCGEDAAAIQAYEQFKRALWQEHEAEPTSETQLLMARVRARLAAQGPPSAEPLFEELAAGAQAEAGADEFESSAGRIEDAPTGGTVAPPAPARGRPRLRALALPLLALLLLSSLGILTAWRREIGGTDPAASTQRVLVLPFRYAGSSDFEFLGEGIVTMLSAGLDGAGELHSVDPGAVLASIARGELLTPGAAREMAVRFGAGVYVLGEIVGVEDRLRVAARLYELRPAGSALLTQVEIKVDSADVFGLIDALTAQLLAALSREPQDRLARIAALTTRSLPALKLYLAGEQHLHAGDYAQGVDALQQAVQVDSTFALAHYRLSTGASWTGQDSLSRASARHATLLADRLTNRDRSLVQAWEAYVFGAAERAEALYLDILSRYPNELEAWQHLGEVRFHWKANLGASISEARMPFERVLRLAPGHAAALMHLARIAASEGRLLSLDSLLTLLQSVTASGEPDPEALALRAYVLHDAVARASFIAAAAGTNSRGLQRVVTSLAVHGGDLEAAERVSRMLLDASTPPLLRAEGYAMRAQVAVARGRAREAQLELANVALTQPGWAAEQRAAMLAFAHVAPSAAALRAARDTLLQAPADIGPPRYQNPADIRWVHRARQQYLLAMLELRLGNDMLARPIAALESFRGDERDRALAHYLARLLRAESEWRLGRAMSALQALGEPRLHYSMLPGITNAERSHERWLRAGLLRDLGRDEEALLWYGTFPDPAGYDLQYLAPSHLRRADIYRQRGDTVRAAEHLRRAEALWAGADPEFLSRLQAAGVPRRVRTTR